MLKKTTIILLSVVFVMGFMWCFENKLPAEKTPVTTITSPTYIQIKITNEMIEDFCQEKGMNGYAIIQNIVVGNITCIESIKLTKNYSKYDAQLWLENNRIISSNEHIVNITDEVYSIFCEQEKMKLESVNNNTITCYSNQYTSEDFLPEDVIKIYLRKHIETINME